MEVTLCPGKTRVMTGREDLTKSLNHFIIYLFIWFYYLVSFIFLFVFSLLLISQSYPIHASRLSPTLI